MNNRNLKQTDLEILEKIIRACLMIEIFHNKHLISDEIYFTKYPENAEKVDLDYTL